MWSGSLRNALHFIVFAIALQLGMVALDFYFQHKSQEVGKKDLAFSLSEYDFLTTLVLEKDTEYEASSLEAFIGRYEKMVQRNEEEGLGLDIGLLKHRIRIISERFSLLEERQKLHSRLNVILPKLAGSVSYIHRHHMAFLQNMSAHGLDEQGYKTAEKFERQDARPASELDILSAAIDIQNSMLEIMEVFSRLQRGFSPKKIHTDFTRTINRFYKATNTFEDYSLDAQDGLLVEELLLNGSTFESSFKNFLDLEGLIQRENKSLEWNRWEIISNLEQAKEAHEESAARVRRQVQYVKTASMTISILILITLLSIARNIILDLRKVVDETSKIEADPRYRIPVRKGEFSEFAHIFNALNMMGKAITLKLDELGESRNVLEEQVAQRTEDLSRANSRLKAEIEERVKNETERRELEERLNRAEKMEAIGTLAGGVAHDLNNLLSGIVSYPELLLMNLPEDHAFRGPLQTIKGSGEKAAVIVEDLLTMARRGVARQEPLNLNHLVESFQASHEFSNIKMHNPEVSFEFYLHAEIATILGSKVHLNKTITNLVSNAAEAIPGEGVVEIVTSNQYVDTTFRSYDHVKEGEYVKLSVKDNGSGISEENLEKIFEPFFTTKSMGRSGSGLGMAVVWGTIKDHNGYIDVRSGRNNGTRFDLYFPLERLTIEIGLEDVKLEDYHAKGEKILVIDDIPEQRDIASSMLEQLGYEVESVNSGERALSFLQENSVDILLLDMIMVPGMDGLETYRQITSLFPGQKAVIVSGFSESEKVRQTQVLGAGAYVKKPYSITDIAVALRKELDK